MNSKIIKLSFLILAGLIIGWREWTSTSENSSEVLVTDALTEVGSTSEASFVLSAFILGAIIALLINGVRYMPAKLSSPNSV